MNPYSTYRLIDLGQGDVFLERPPLEASRDKVYHTILPGETIQSIAYKYYGDSGKWADICDMNNILFPFEELEEGMQLLIPF